MNRLIHTLITWIKAYPHKKEWGIVALCFVISIGFKVYWVWNSPGPWLFFDEYYYKQASYNLFFLGKYYVDGGLFTQYPPLYSLIIAPAFLFGDNWYKAILIINSIVSSISVFFIYSISRKFLSKTDSIICVILCAILPYNLIFTRMVMSENLFVPLFLSAFIEFFVDEAQGSKWRLLANGILLGLCFLTKYLFLFFIPIFVIADLLSYLLDKNFRGHRHIREMFSRIIYIGIGFLLTLTPWYIYCISNGSGFLDPLGGNIQGISSTQQTFIFDKGIIIWLFANVLLLILSISPYLSSILTFSYSGGKIRKEHTIISFAFLMIFIMTLVVSVTSNNYFKSSSGGAYFDERYWLPILVLLPFISFLSLKYVNSKPIRFWQSITIFLISSFIICLSYLMLVTKTMWQESPYNNIHSTFSAGYNFEKLFVNDHIRILLPIIILINLVLIIRNQKILKITFVSFIIGFYLISNYYDAKGLIEFYQKPAIHSINIFSVMSEDQFIANTEIVIDDNIFFNERSIYWGLKFWGNEEFDIIKTSEFTYVQNNQACDWLSLREGEDVDSTYTLDEVTYYINDCAGINQGTK
jgi:hypothetical protein